LNNIEKLAVDIAAYGTEYIFGITGSGQSLELVDSLEKNNVSFVRTQFEGTAAIMAGVHGRLSGKSGISTSIKGPGLTNMIPGLAVCWFESLPVVAICESYPDYSNNEKAHKRINHSKLVAAVTKGRRFVTSIGPDFSEMAKWAEQESPAPVLYEMAGDQVVNISDTFGVKKELDIDLSILEIIKKSDRPVIIAGSLAIRLNWSDALNNLEFPVFSTAAAKGVVNETLSHSAGVYTGVGLEMTSEYQLIEDADLVIGIGLRPREILTTRPFPCTSINIDNLGIVSGGEHFNFKAYSGCEIEDELFLELSKKKWGFDKLATCKELLYKSLLNDEFLPAHVFDIISRRYSNNVRMVIDTGYFCTIAEHIWQSKQTDWCLLAGQSRYMGTAIPMAIGASIYDRSIPTIAVIGDGSIGPFIGELRLAVEYRLPLLVLLLTDGRFGSIATRSIHDGLTQIPLTIYEPSWIKIIEGFNITGTIADNYNSFETALALWEPESGPAYIEVPFDKDAYEMMVKGVR
jgi:acetolactate synthase I/II/III large subunit